MSKSGYVVKITAFLPCNPNQPEDMARAAGLLNALQQRTQNGAWDEAYKALDEVQVTQQYVARRRKEPDLAGATTEGPA